MSSTEIREELHQIIDRIEDNKILEAAYTLLETQDIVAHSTTGHALTQKEFETRIRQGEEDIEHGRVHTHEQVKEHFRNKLSQ